MNFTASTIEKILKFIPCHVKYIPSEGYKAAELPNESKISRRSSQYSSFPAERRIADGILCFFARVVKREISLE